MWMVGLEGLNGHALKTVVTAVSRVAKVVKSTVFCLEKLSEGS